MQSGAFMACRKASWLTFAMVIYLVLVSFLFLSYFSSDSVTITDNSSTTASTSVAINATGTQSAALSANTKRNLKNPPPKTSSTKPKTQQISGLYTESKFVTEIGSERQLIGLIKAERKPLIMTVFYASWCGHCRNFVPTFTSIAETTTNKILELNSYQKNPTYTNITFTAVNCVVLRDLCNKQKIDFYPTVIPFNFPTSTTKLQGIKNDIQKFLKTHYFTHNELDASSILAMKKNKASTTTGPQQVLSPAPSHQAHTASSTNRLHDAWMSYLYFLTNELPSEITTIRAKKLVTFVSMVHHLLPSLHKQSEEEDGLKASLHTGITTLTYQYSRSAYVPRAKLIARVSQIMQEHKLPKLIEWHSCGVPIDSNGNNGNGTTTEAAKGYTCGLWILFHFLTLHHPNSANSNSSSRVWNASNIMSTLYDFIEEFFGCHACKLHFMHYYKACWYGRCEIIHTNNNNNQSIASSSSSLQQQQHNEEEEYARLQLWLFYLHNYVSCRIYLESAVSSSSSSLLLLPLVHNNDNAADETKKDQQQMILSQLIRNKLWPVYATCPDCYTAPVLPIQEETLVTLFSSSQQQQQQKQHLRKKGGMVMEEEYLEALIKPEIAKAFNETKVLQYLQQVAFSVN